MCGTPGPHSSAARPAALLCKTGAASFTTFHSLKRQPPDNPFSFSSHSSIQLTQIINFFRKPFRNLSLCHSPLPVSSKGGGHVDSRFASKPQIILHGNYGRIRNASKGCPDEIPLQLTAGFDVQIFSGKAAVTSADSLIPTNCGIVVMGSGVLRNLPYNYGAGNRFPPWSQRRTAKPSFPDNRSF